MNQAKKTLTKTLVIGILGLIVLISGCTKKPDYMDGYIEGLIDGGFICKEIIENKTTTTTIGRIRFTNKTKEPVFRIIHGNMGMKPKVKLVDANYSFFEFKFDNKTIGCSGIRIDKNGYLRCLNMEVIK